jgi:small subunit ribosomal protein S20
MAEEKKKVRVKKPTALKRDEQSLKRNLRNRSFKSKVATALRSFEDSLSKKEAATIKQNVNLLTSLMDKGVKKGIFKLNKASRVKSRLSARVKGAV